MKAEEEEEEAGTKLSGRMPAARYTSRNSKLREIHEGMTCGFGMKTPEGEEREERGKEGVEEEEGEVEVERLRANVWFLL
jgi:hypothetical protein